MKKKRIYLTVIILLVVVSIVFIAAKALQPRKIEAVNYADDYVKMPKGFSDLPEYNEDNDKDHVSIVLQENQCSSTIFVVNPETCTGLTENKGLTENEKLLLTSLQGIVAQERAEIYIGKITDKWIRYVSKEYNIALEKKNSLTELIEHYKDKIKGYVKAEWKADNLYNEQINQASTLSGAEQLLIVAVGNSNRGTKTIEKIDSLGFECKYDLTTLNTTEIEIEKVDNAGDVG